MDGLKHLHKDIELPLESKLDLYLGKLSFTDSQKGFLRPLTKPVDGTSIDQTGEHSEPGSKSLPNGTHAHDDVDVPFDPGQIHGKDVHLIGLQVLLSTVTLTTVDYVLHVFLVVHVGHVTTVQNAVDVLEHLLVYNLSVHE